MVRHPSMNVRLNKLTNRQPTPGELALIAAQLERTTGCSKDDAILEALDRWYRSDALLTHLGDLARYQSDDRSQELEAPSEILRRNADQSPADCFDLLQAVTPADKANRAVNLFASLKAEYLPAALTALGLGTKTDSIWKRYRETITPYLNSLLKNG
jgi:hypothetical protein